MREIPNCWLMGQAAGIDAAIAVKTGANLRDVSILEFVSGCCLPLKIGRE